MGDKRFLRPCCASQKAWERVASLLKALTVHSTEHLCRRATGYKYILSRSQARGKGRQRPGPAAPPPPARARPMPACLVGTVLVLLYLEVGRQGRVLKEDTRDTLVCAMAFPHGNAKKDRRRPLTGRRFKQTSCCRRCRSREARKVLASDVECSISLGFSGPLAACSPPLIHSVWGSLPAWKVAGAPPPRYACQLQFYVRALQQSKYWSSTELQ